MALDILLKKRQALVSEGEKLARRMEGIAAGVRLLDEQIREERESEGRQQDRKTIMGWFRGMKALPPPPEDE